MVQTVHDEGHRALWVEDNRARIVELGDCAYAVRNAAGGCYAGGGADGKRLEVKLANEMVPLVCDERSGRHRRDGRIYRLPAGLRERPLVRTLRRAECDTPRRVEARRGAARGIHGARAAREPRDGGDQGASLGLLRQVAQHHLADSVGTVCHEHVVQSHVRCDATAHIREGPKNNEGDGGG